MKKLMLTINLLLLFILFPTLLLAATHCIRSGASGSTCADWGANACNALPSTLVRGDTYYIASGSYSGRTFSTATSGTSLITIKGATAADHGTDTGWNNSYSVSTADGGGQATWSGGLTFTTSYWVFDGSVGSMTKTPSAYGFSFGTGGTAIINATVAGGNLTISHVYAQATSSDVAKGFFQNSFNGAWNNTTISYCLLDGWQVTMWSRGSGYVNDNWRFDHCVALNLSSTSSNHGSGFDADSAPLSNLYVTNSYFEGNSGNAGLTAIVEANNADIQSAYVYGNVFNNVTSGDGIISDTSAGCIKNTKVYNNTFANCCIATQQIIQAMYSCSTGNTAYNNLFYHNSTNCGSTPSYATDITFQTHDYNAFFAQSGGYPSESHGQSSSTNPFVNSASNLPAGFKLLAASSNGTTLTAPYNVDPEGNTRGADGVWDRGAYEFGTGGSGGAVKPMPPTLH